MEAGACGQRHSCFISTIFATAATAEIAVQEFAVRVGTHPHDVAPATDGGVWYTAQRKGELGWLDPKTGRIRHVLLGEGSSPHGVIVGPDGAAPESGADKLAMIKTR